MIYSRKVEEQLQVYQWHHNQQHDNQQHRHEVSHPVADNIMYCNVSNTMPSSTIATEA